MAGAEVKAPSYEYDDGAGWRWPPDAESNGAAREPQRRAKTLPHGKRTTTRATGQPDRPRGFLFSLFLGLCPKPRRRFEHSPSEGRALARFAYAGCARWFGLCPEGP